MSFLTIALQVVAVAAAVVSGGILAGALVALSALSADHVIGGSVGKFFNSGWGKGLVAAVSLGSAAYNMVSAGAAAAQSGQAATTTSGFMAQNGVDSATVQAMQDPGMMSAGVTPVDVNAANATADAASGGAGAGAGAANTTAVANSSQVAAQQTAGAENAVGAGGGTVSSTPIDALKPVDSAGAGGAAPEPGAAQVASSSAPAGGVAGDQAAVAPNGAAAPEPGASSAAAGNASVAANAAGNAAPSGGLTGMFGRAVDAIDKHPGLANVAGKVISGYAQGRSEEEMMNKQLAAAQWGNMQWRDPQKVAQLQSAAAAPITVPSGYLSRALAVRNLMTGNSQQTGPVMGVQPAAPTPGPGAALPAPKVGG